MNRVLLCLLFNLAFLPIKNTIAITFSDEQLNKLAAHKQWLKLLHYNKAHQKSYISSPSFFLNQTQNFNPKKELIATLKAFYQPLQLGQSADEHAQCRFPARLLFIKQHITTVLSRSLPLVSCLKYQKWRDEKNTKSISIIFASGYMSNPASMYGHLLLKLNKNNQSNNKLLNYSLNYGAIVPDNENPVLYVIKGIFGGYKAAYSDQQFYRHHHNYSDIELRDMWEYELNLSSHDINLLVAHIWELLGKKFDYYFIDENCAFHIAKLIELVVDDPIINNQSLWVIPSSVANGLNNANYQHKPLVKQISFIPSAESTLHQYVTLLTQTQRNVVHTIITTEFNFATTAYTKLPEHDKKVIIETLFQYLNVLKQKDTTDNNIAKNRKKLIQERLALSSGKALQLPPLSISLPPHKGMKPSKFSLGYSHISTQNNFISTGFRMTYFDDLSSSIARNKFANLEMVDVEILTNNQKTVLKKLDLIDIKSLYKINTPWLNKNTAAWTVKAGYQQRYNDCLDCGIYFAEGEWGKSTLLNNWLAYSLIGGKAFVGDNSNIDISLKLGLIAPLYKNIKAKIEVKKSTTISFNEIYQTQITAAVNYHIAKNWEIRLQAEKKEATLIALKVNYFWDW